MKKTKKLLPIVLPYDAITTASWLPDNGYDSISSFVSKDLSARPTGSLDGGFTWEATKLTRDEPWRILAADSSSRIEI